MQRFGMTVPFDGQQLHEQRDRFERLERLGYTDLWTAEAMGADGLTPLTLGAVWTPSMRLGTAILPAYTRGPALLAQSVAGLASAAPGRFVLGIGSSSNVIVERWNGIPFEKPFQQTRDMVRFLTASTSPPDSATRRSARTLGDAVTKSFRSASGRTTVVISRPSTTPDPRSRIHARCNSTRNLRTSGVAATALTAEVTSGPRIAVVASTPSTTTRSALMLSSSRRHTAITESASEGSISRDRTPNVTARYIAPVSRYSIPNSVATRRATVLLPAPAGPSIAMITGVLTNSFRVVDPLRSPHGFAPQRPRAHGIQGSFPLQRMCTTTERQQRFDR